MSAANRSPIAVASGVWGYPAPTLTTDGRAMFYVAKDPPPAARA